MRKFMIFLTTGWAGFFMMALELLGGRILFPYFGGTVNIWGGLICVFLLFLSLGHLTGGSLSKMGPNVRMMAVFLFAAAALVLPIYAKADAILYWVFTHIFNPSYGALLASFCLFAAPTYILGMVTPYAMRLLSTDQEQSGSTAGWLYFSGTVGSAFGTIMTSFYLVLWLQLPYIYLGLVIISVLIGLLTFFVASGDDGY